MTSAILNIIAPVFVIILAGYLAVRLRLFPKEGVRYVMVYAQSFAVPLLLFNALVTIDFSKSFRLDILTSYFLPMLIVFSIGFWIGRRFGKNNVSSTVLGFNAFFANSVLLGLPIAERAFGTESLWVNYVIVSMHSPFGYLTGALAMEFAKPNAPKLLKTLSNAFFELIKNPLIIGILAGLIVNLTHITLPHFLQDAIDMQARAALPAAIFALGGVLTGFQIKGAIGPILSISIVRLFVHAGLVLFIGQYIFHLDRAILASLILIATMPTGTNGFIFASIYKTEEQNSASIVFFTTLVAVLTIPLWLTILEVL